MTTPRDNIDGLSKRLRKTLAGVEPDDFGGDNLAIFIASELEPSIDDETLDDSGTWKQGAIDACDRVLDAIHAHYATAIDAILKERDALRSYADELFRENGIVRDMLLNPNPDQEPDNVRLHREKCDAIDRAFKAEQERDALQARVKELEAERDEARKAANLGCDARNGDAHSIMVEGSYKFCTGCGETIRTPTLQERARAAEARADALQARVKELDGFASDLEVLKNLYRKACEDAESRATRLQQEAYERAAKQAEQFAPPHSMDLGKGHVAWRIAAAIRQLAARNEKEGE